MLGDVRSCSPEKSCLQPTIQYLGLFMNHLSPIPSQEINYYSYRTLINSRLYWPDPVILFLLPQLSLAISLFYFGALRAVTSLSIHLLTSLVFPPSNIVAHLCLFFYLGIVRREFPWRINCFERSWEQHNAPQQPQ